MATTVARAMIPRMSTLAVLLEALAAARRSGADFDAAWEGASTEALGASCAAGDWAPVLDSTRDGWASAYRRWPASPAERSLTSLAFGAELADIGRRKGTVSGIPDVGRACRRCGDPIPPERFERSPPVYCTDECRKLWHRERERVAA